MEHKQITYYLMIFVTIVCISIAFSLYVEDKKTSCSDCKVKFTTMETSGVKLNQYHIIEEKMTNLFSELENGQCLVRWDRTGGYYRDGLR